MQRLHICVIILSDTWLPGCLSCEWQQAGLNCSHHPKISVAFGFHAQAVKQTNRVQCCAQRLPCLVSYSKAAHEYLLTILQGALWNFWGHGPQMICKEMIVMILGNLSPSPVSSLCSHSAALNAFPQGCVWKGRLYEWKLQANRVDLSHSSSFACYYGSEKCSLMAHELKAWKPAKDTIGKGWSL